MFAYHVFLHYASFSSMILISTLSSTMSSTPMLSSTKQSCLFDRAQLRFKHQTYHVPNAFGEEKPHPKPFYPLHPTIVLTIELKSSA